MDACTRRTGRPPRDAKNNHALQVTDHRVPNLVDFILHSDKHLLEFVATLAMFPILAWFFVRTHRRVLARV